MSFISIGEAKNESGILFAGAGAGSGAGSNSIGYTYGGYGGGVSGGDGTPCGNTCGSGATQTSPGTNTQNSVRNGGKFYGGNCGQDAGWATGGGSGYYGGAGSSGGGEVHSSILHLSKTEKQLQVTKKCLHLFQKQKTSPETKDMDTLESHFLDILLRFLLQLGAIITLVQISL